MAGIISGARFALGEMQLIIGPMFSGKSSELLRRARRYQYARKRVMVLKYAKDTRYSVDKVSTHDQIMMTAVGCVKLDAVEEQAVDDHDVIAIDEGQFFPDLLTFAERWANQGKTVIIAALDADFRREPFGTVCELVARAEKVTKLSSVCSVCGKDAFFTKRTVQGDEQELIGGSESYIPVCRTCYFSDESEPPATGLATPATKKSLAGSKTKGGSGGSGVTGEAKKADMSSLGAQKPNQSPSPKVPSDERKETKQTTTTTTTTTTMSSNQVPSPVSASFAIH